MKNLVETTSDATASVVSSMLRLAQSPFRGISGKSVTASIIFMMTAGVACGILAQPKSPDIGFSALVMTGTALVVMGTAPLMKLFGRFAWFLVGVLYAGIAIGFYSAVIFHGAVFCCGWLMMWVLIHFYG